MSLVILDCPECGKRLIMQPSVSPGTMLAFCYGKITKKDKNRKPIEAPCGYRGFYLEYSKELKPLQLKLKRGEK